MICSLAAPAAHRKSPSVAAMSSTPSRTPSDRARQSSLQPLTTRRSSAGTSRGSVGGVAQHDPLPVRSLAKSASVLPPDRARHNVEDRPRTSAGRGTAAQPSRREMIEQHLGAAQQRHTLAVNALRHRVQQMDDCLPFKRRVGSPAEKQELPNAATTVTPAEEVRARSACLSP